MKTVTGNLPNGLVIDGMAHRDFEMREASVGDMFDAEGEADVMRPLTFNGQMMLRQLVSVGTFTGPFTMGMLRSLKPADYRTLRGKQMELESEGEAGGGGGSAEQAS
jgi:phage FluMu protein gp41